jgi:hypothetical protein
MTMTDDRTVSLTISLPKHYRDLLRKKAAEWSMTNPDELLTGARIARDIVIEYLDGWEKDQGSSDSKNDVQIHEKEKI